MSFIIPAGVALFVTLKIVAAVTVYRAYRRHSDPSVKSARQNLATARKDERLCRSRLQRTEAAYDADRNNNAKHYAYALADFAATRAERSLADAQSAYAQAKHDYKVRRRAASGRRQSPPSEG